MAELTDEIREIIDWGNNGIIIMTRLLSLNYKLLFYMNKMMALDSLDEYISDELIEFAKEKYGKDYILEECNNLEMLRDEYINQFLPLFEAWEVDTSIFLNISTLSSKENDPVFESLIRIITQSPVDQNEFFQISEYYRILEMIVDRLKNIFENRHQMFMELSSLMRVNDPIKAREKNIYKSETIASHHLIEWYGIGYRLRTAIDIASDRESDAVRGHSLGASLGGFNTCYSDAKISNSDFNLSTVDFSVLAPSKISIDESSVIDIFAYEYGYRHIIDKALETENAIEKPMGQSHVKTKAKITMVLSSEGLIIDDNKAERIWEGGYLRFSFLIRVRKNFQENKIPVSATVFIDNVVATQIQFLIDRSSSVQEGTGISVYRKDIMSVFMSYASRDRNRVISIIQGMKKVRPEINIFFDIDNLRSGEHWQSVIQREIDTHDYLMLCWSRYAKESQWVDKEWRYAYETKGEEYIEPIPLENPVYCPPPLELANKHFNDKYIMFAKEEDRYIYCEEKLGRLKHLHDMQLISLEDYNALKKSVLSEFFKN